MDKLIGVTVGVLAIVLIFGIVPFLADTIEAGSYGDQTVESICVFILENDTTATHVTCAIYDTHTNRIIAQTEEQYITTNAWNVCEFSIPPKVEMNHNYVLTAFADGTINVPAESNTDYIQDTGNTYADFPTYIDYNGESTAMSIYAIYT
jgi:hypothetical protein